MTSSVASLLPPVRLRLVAARGAWPVYRLLAIMAALIGPLAMAGGFVVESRDLPTVVAVMGLALVGAAMLRGGGRVRVADGIECAVLLPLAAMAAVFLTMVLAPLAPPYADPWLATIDRWLVPFSWPSMILAIRDHRWLVVAMEGVYRSLGWQQFLLVALLAATGQGGRGYRFVHAWVLTLVACVATFGLMPAMTSYVFYGFTPADLPHLTVDAGWTPHRIIETLRHGGARELSIGTMDGLIDFPSFHAAGATLLAWGFRRIPVIGGAFVALNGLMLLTVPMIGSHYFIDVIVGVAVALVAIRATRQ